MITYHIVWSEKPEDFKYAKCWAYPNAFKKLEDAESARQDAEIEIQPRKGKFIIVTREDWDGDIAKDF